MLLMFFCPAVGYALFTSCRSALLASFHLDHPSVRVYPVCWRTRAPYTPSFAVWCLGLSRACVVSTSCSPVHVLTHVFAAHGPVSPRTLAPLPFTRLCVWRALSPELGCFTLGMVVNSAMPCVLPLSCVAGNTSTLSLCLEGLHTAPFVGLCSARSPAIVHCGTR